jgi:hypothetical protein
MTLPPALRAIVEALRSAGATEEIIAAAVKVAGEIGISLAAAVAVLGSMRTIRRASAPGKKG